jgi:elongation factor Ts
VIKVWRVREKLGAGRTMNEGVIEVYSHHNQRLGVIVEVNCETDFVANTPSSACLLMMSPCKSANLAPEYVRLEDVPEAVIQAERELAPPRA